MKENIDFPYVYGAINKSEDVLLNSSSGGVTSELCRVILKSGGAVCAAAYDYESHKLQHIMIQGTMDIEKIRGSKYFQSDMSNVYKSIEAFLLHNAEKTLLFIGTPCQCAAVKKYVKTKKFPDEKLIYVDIICHGVGSNKIWDDFVNDIEKKNKVKIKKITFKDKRRGWLLPYSVAYSSDGKEYDLCDYMTLYNKTLIMRDECHVCPFAKSARVGDITVGDFWNVKKSAPDFYNSNGVSSILCNTEKGHSLFLSVQELFDTIPITLDDCVQPNMVYPTQKNPLSDLFWKDYQKKGFKYIRKKYASKTLFDRMVRRFLVKIGLWKV